MKDLWLKIEPPVILQMPESSWFKDLLIGGIGAGGALLGAAIGAGITVYYANQQKKNDILNSEINDALGICVQLQYMIGHLNIFKKHVEDQLNNANDNKRLITRLNLITSKYLWWPLIQPTLSAGQKNINISDMNFQILLKNNLEGFTEKLQSAIYKYNLFLSLDGYYNSSRLDISEFGLSNRQINLNITQDGIKFDEKIYQAYLIKSDLIEKHLRDTYTYTIQTLVYLNGLLLELVTLFKKNYGDDFPLNPLSKQGTSHNIDV